MKQQSETGKRESEVANHYNARPQNTRPERDFSPIFQLKAFNNYIKSILIRTFVKKDGYRILDICCGKGGDLLKYSRLRISEFYGLDVAGVSIEQAKERFDSGHFRFKATFQEVDCFSEDLTFSLFDLVSAQFSLH